MSGKKWAGLPLLGFDVETTGVSVWEDRIVTASVIAYRPGPHGEDTGQHDVCEWLINPGVEIPAEATEVHGITTGHAREHGVDPAQALFEIAGLIAVSLNRGIPVVAFNAAFDITMLEVECRRHGVDSLIARVGRHGINPIIDPLVLDKHAEPRRRGSRKLLDLARHYKVEMDAAQAHNSTADTMAACRLAGTVLEWWPRQFSNHTVATLHASQVGWRRQQMDSLREYFDKKGIAHDGCDPSWPLYMPPTGVTLPGAVA